MAGRRARSARPTRARSQHFLRTSRLAAELVRDACVGPNDVAVDLGAGTGRLTAELARVARRVVAVEVDPRLAARLQGRWPNVDVVVGDATRVPLPREPFRVVANVPFARTTAILRRLLDDPRTPLVRADLVVAWGVAQKRVLPWPSTLNGVLWAAWYETSVSRRLPRSAFVPPPSVDAGVLVYIRRAVPLIPEREWRRYRGFVATGFRRGLRAVAAPRALRRMGIEGAAPRELDAHQWAALYSTITGPSIAASSRRAETSPS
ncbi:MAG TPA: rRNA adenine N-6-methyltransferase family protein [Gaiellaceae bacterium]|nr:rRNA adenine N-6-methyltransferase family protein [Gaiellaceae bacterium]